MVQKRSQANVECERMWHVRRMRHARRMQHVRRKRRMKMLPRISAAVPILQSHTFFNLIFRHLLISPPVYTPNRLISNHNRLDRLTLTFVLRLKLESFQVLTYAYDSLTGPISAKTMSS